METIYVKLPHYSYPVFIGYKNIGDLRKTMEQHNPMQQIAVISSPSIMELYGPMLRKTFGSETLFLQVPDGEKAKSNEYVQQLYTRLLEKRFERNSVIVAFGGGVIGDLAGYVAATYLRGVDFVQVPTTLLAQVDSSIGGKVGINHPLGKNLIGAFKQPLFVFCDTYLVHTLPPEEIRCGIGEIIKYAFILDAKLFDFLEKNLEKGLDGDAQVLQYLVSKSAAHKADVVSQDEKENYLRMVLNFGHTFGHALEAEYKYKDLKHGEAVVLGMRCALHYAHQMKFLADAEYARGIKLLKRVPVRIDFSGMDTDTDRLMERITVDKKIRDKKIRLVLIKKIGAYLIEEDGNVNLIKQSFNALMRGEI